MSDITQDQVIDLSMNIIKDSKRRLLYWDPKNKKGYQINQKDIKWVKAYEMLFVVGVLIFTLVQLALNSIIAFVIAIVGTLAIHLYFQNFYFKDKIPFKVHDKDLDKLLLPAVLKQKRTLEIYKMLFVVLLGFLEVGKIVGQDVSNPRYYLTFLFLAVLLVVRGNALWIAHRKYKKFQNQPIN